MQNKVWRFIVDTGSSISIIKEGLSRRAIHKTNLSAQGITGEKLSIIGEQQIDFNMSNTSCMSVRHRFLVINGNCLATYDGILGLDIMKRLKVTLNLGDGYLQCRNKCCKVELGLCRDDTYSTEPYQELQSDQLEPREQSPSLKRPKSQSVWRVVNSTSQSLPPMSEVITRGSLISHSGDQLGDVAPNTVLIEPRELDVQGICVARVLSNVSKSDQGVVIKVVNCSKERIELQKGIMLGLAEEYPQPGDHVSATSSAEGEQVKVSNSSNMLRDDVSATASVAGGHVHVMRENRDKMCNKVARIDVDCIETVIRDKLSHLSREEFEVLYPLLLRYKKLFGEDIENKGCLTGVKHRIYTGDQPPIKKKPYRVPEALKPIVQEQIDDMLRKSIISPSDSPYNFPVVVVPKKLGSDGVRKYRFCVDYRALNTITKGDAYPIPNITETLDCLGKCKYFTTIDLASGYHQVQMHEDDKEKTGFSIPGYHFEFNRMPFGLKNAPATFQRLMDSVLTGISGIEALVYLDDIIVFSPDIYSHADRLQRVFERLQRANLYMQLDKCVFGGKQVEYLGHVVTDEGVKPDPKKIIAVRDYPKPKTVRDIRAFLGLVGYYRRFIPNFAALAKPLTELTKQTVEFKWTDTQENAFCTLKDMLQTEPILRYPDYTLEFRLATDASATAIGAVLSQVHEGHEHPVAYASRQLSKAERNYSVTERELLALVWATKYFRCYLYGRKFIAITDHAALRWMLSLKDPSSRLTRWALRLSEFEYEVQHKPGKKHSNCDALSRHVNTVTIPYLSREIILSEQEKDEFCNKFKTSNVSNDEPYFKDNDGLVYRRTEKVMQLVIPRSLINRVIEQHHDTPFSGHQGIKRTLAILQERYYWPTMKSDVHDYIMKCLSCNQRKTHDYRVAPMKIIEPAMKPFALVSLDIVGPLPTTKNGNKYLLTFIDYLTRYCEAFAISDQTSETVAKVFVKGVITRHGIPKKLLTDQGRNFVSSLFKETCKLLKIKKIQTTPYHPQTNGLLERLHKTIVDMMSHYVNKNASNWDEYVPYAMMAYRSTKHSVTGYSPHELLYGEKMNLPVDDDLDVKNVNEENAHNIQSLASKLKEAREIAIQTTQKARQTNKRRYDKRSKTVNYEVGDKVFIFNPAVKKSLKRKFSKPWSGPYDIIEKISDTNYRIQLDNKTTIVHVNRLKKALTVDKHLKLAKHGKPQTETHEEVSPTASNLHDLSDQPDDDETTILPIRNRPILITAEPIDVTEQVIGNTADSDDDLSSTVASEHGRDSDYEPETTVSPTLPSARDAPAFNLRPRTQQTK